MPIVALLTALGVALRLVVARQSLFADELATYTVVSSGGLGDVVSRVHTDVEITPPLYFAAAWLTTRIDLTPELLRAPSLLAGAAAIPLVYAIGMRTVGRPAALVATAFTALSPFMIYYSTEARGYELMIVLVMLSTLALLAAVDGGRARWWIAYAACSCAAVYTHYTSVFALAGQLLWLLWAHPEARRAALLANVGGAVAFLPWLSGLRGDLESPTTDILSALQPFDARFVRSSLTHWAVGYPYATPLTRLRDLPGLPALAMLALGVVIASAGIVRARLRAPSPFRLDRRVALVVVLAVSVPAGEALASAVGSNVFGTRNLAASWPAFALCLAAFLLAGGRRLGAAAAALALGAFAIGAAKMLDKDFQRPDYQAVARAIDREAANGDVVVDAASLNPDGVTTALEAAFTRPHRVLNPRKGTVEYDPFRIVALAPPVSTVVRTATAGDGRVYLVLVAGSQSAREAVAALPERYRRTETRRWPGVNPLVLVVAEPR